MGSITTRRHSSLLYSIHTTASARRKSAFYLSQRKSKCILLSGITGNKENQKNDQLIMHATIHYHTYVLLITIQYSPHRVSSSKKCI